LLLPAPVVLAECQDTADAESKLPCVVCAVS
jgi:hypothetical protein